MVLVHRLEVLLIPVDLRRDQRPFLAFSAGISLE
jgi:hypothetical protein